MVGLGCEAHLKPEVEVPVLVGQGLGTGQEQKGEHGEDSRWAVHGDQA